MKVKLQLIALFLSFITVGSIAYLYWDIYGPSRMYFSPSDGYEVFDAPGIRIRNGKSGGTIAVTYEYLTQKSVKDLKLLAAIHGIDQQINPNKENPYQTALEEIQLEAKRTNNGNTDDMIKERHIRFVLF